MHRGGIKPGATEIAGSLKPRGRAGAAAYSRSVPCIRDHAGAADANALDRVRRTQHLDIGAAGAAIQWPCSATRRGPEINR